MEITHQSLFHYRLLPLFLLLILRTRLRLKRPSRRDYQTEGKTCPGRVATVLELKANGDGAWKSGGEEIPFSWHIKGGDAGTSTPKGAESSLAALKRI